MADPTLRQLIDLVETSAKPVIVATAGTCIGGGLELAAPCFPSLVET